MLPSWSFSVEVGGLVADLDAPWMPSPSSVASVLLGAGDGAGRESTSGAPRLQVARRGQVVGQQVDQRGDGTTVDLARARPHSSAVWARWRRRARSWPPGCRARRSGRRRSSRAWPAPSRSLRSISEREQRVVDRPGAAAGGRRRPPRPRRRRSRPAPAPRARGPRPRPACGPARSGGSP